MKLENNEPRRSTAYENVQKNKDDKRLSAVKKKHKKRKAGNKLTAFLAVAAILAVTAGIVLDKFFAVENFKISGSAEYTYTAEQAQSAAELIGIPKGGSIFKIDKKKAESEAKYRLSEFDSVKIEFELPNTVVLSVKEALPAMYTVLDDGRAYVLSENLRVVKVFDDASEAEKLGLVRVQLSGVSNSIAGEFIETASGSDSILKELYAVLKEEKLISDTTSIDAANKYELSFEYKRRFIVKLGSGENVTVRVRFMKSVVNELSENDSGVIDVSDANLREWSFKAYNKM